MVERKDINGETSLRVVVRFLEENYPDKYPREIMTDYTLGIGVGKLEVIDLLKLLCKDK